MVSGAGAHPQLVGSIFCLPPRQCSSMLLPGPDTQQSPSTDLWDLASTTQPLAWDNVGVVEVRSGTEAERDQTSCPDDVPHTAAASSLGTFGAILCSSTSDAPCGLQMFKALKIDSASRAPGWDPAACAPVPSHIGGSLHTTTVMQPCGSTGTRLSSCPTAPSHSSPAPLCIHSASLLHAPNPQLSCRVK